MSQAIDDLNLLDIDDSDEVVDPVDFDGPAKEYELPSVDSLPSTKLTRKHLSQTDASSIIGGDSVDEVGIQLIDDDDILEVEEYDGPKGTTEKLSDPIKKKTIGVKATQKVFLFSLPFGGLSNIRSNLYRQVQSFRAQSSIPLIHSPTAAAAAAAAASTGKVTGSLNPDYDEINLKLKRLQSLNTIQEEALFRNYRGSDDARLRAMRQSIAASVNGMVHPIRKREKPWETAFNELDGNVIILGGYRGSVLRDARTHKRVWIPIKAGFNLRKVNLLLGPTKQDELEASKFIYPDGILKNVGPMDIAKRLIKKITSNPKVNFNDFGYDWRLSGEVVSRQLEQYMDDIYCKTQQPSLVIAHSMGGMMAHSVMQRRPELFRGIVYVGCPSECLNVLGPIRFGDTVGFLDRILTPETNFMMRSGFNFLPLSGKVFVNKTTKELYDLDYFDPDTWVEYDLNPLVSRRRRDEAAAGGGAATTASIMNRTDLGFLLLSDSISLPSINSISSKIKSYRRKKPTSLGISGSSTPSSSAPSNGSGSGAAGSKSHAGAGGPPVGSSPSGPPAASENPNFSISPIAPGPQDQSRAIWARSPTSPEPTDKSFLSPSSPGQTDASLSPKRSTSKSPEITEDDDFISESYSILFQQAYDYLKEALASAKKFVLGLEYKPELESKYPPLAVVYGNQVPSVRGSHVDSIQDIKDGNYYHFYYGHGDGVIHQKWLMPETRGFQFYDRETGEGQIVGKFASAAGHVNLMTDLRAIGNALNSILEAEGNWKIGKSVRAKASKTEESLNGTSSVPTASSTVEVSTTN